MRRGIVEGGFSRHGRHGRGYGPQPGEFLRPAAKRMYAGPPMLCRGSQLLTGCAAVSWRRALCCCIQARPTFEAVPGVLAPRDVYIILMSPAYLFLI